VVYQSKFVKKACHKYLGKCKWERVIYNGADPMFYLDLKKWQSPYRFNFCAVTRKWIKQKRLKDIIKAFKEAAIYDSCLLIVGQILGNEKKHAARNIMFLGSMDDRQVGRVYRASRALIHMCYLDACPNSVVEATCAGIPTITGDQGGAPEISTHQIRDKKWDFKPIDLENPPKANRKELANVLNIIAATPQTVYSDQVQIESIAQQYMEYFREIL
jgi:glycosyltransferase involved in cell wall biosynthesis